MVASPPCSILNRLVQVVTAFQKLPFCLNYLAFSEPRMPAARHTQLIFSAGVRKKKEEKSYFSRGSVTPVDPTFLTSCITKYIKGKFKE